MARQGCNLAVQCQCAAHAYHSARSLCCCCATQSTQRRLPLHCGPLVQYVSSFHKTRALQRGKLAARTIVWAEAVTHPAVTTGDGCCAARLKYALDDLIGLSSEHNRQQSSALRRLKLSQNSVESWDGAGTAPRRPSASHFSPHWAHCRSTGSAEPALAHRWRLRTCVGMGVPRLFESPYFAALFTL